MSQKQSSAIPDKLNKLRKGNNMKLKCRSKDLNHVEKLKKTRRNKARSITQQGEMEHVDWGKGRWF